MLSRIQIQNYLIFKNVDIDFSKGLNVITGETGSGKSLVISSINFCLKAKGKENLIGNFDDKLIVTLVFNMREDLKEFFDESSIDVEDEIIITRSLSKDGKKRLLINNQQVTQKILDHISDKLILIYGQHSFGKLFQPSLHAEILDNFMDDKESLLNISQKYSKLKEVESKIISLKKLKEKSEAEDEFLRHAFKELKNANIFPGEEEELINSRIEMQKKAKYSDLISDLLDNLRNNQISTKLVSLSKTITRSNYSDDFEEILKNIDEALDKTCEAENLLERMSENNFSQNELEKIEDRLFQIKDLSRKYKIPSEQIVQYISDLEKKISQIDNFTSDLKKLDQQFTEAKNEYLSLATNLSEMRKISAKKIEDIIAKELSFLQMKNCRFKVQILSDESKFSDKGFDKISFTASTNPGTPFAAIDKIASGGEMARFMLALQVSILSKIKNLPAIIFDEIDTGIGGSVADSVGDRLKKLSELSQVFAITHQPQVAGKSDCHILIYKNLIDDNTISNASIIIQDEKVKELARMISGKNITEKAIEAAKTLIA